MSISSVISSNNNQYKKIFSKFSNNNRINVNHLILNKNKSDKNFFDNNYNKNNLKKIIIKKDKVIPFNSTRFNKSISINIYKAKDNFPKTKKYYIKSPISFFKGVSLPSTQNLNSNKNIPLLSINTNKNTNISQDNPQKTVEYNSINCIINNFNVSCKSIGSHEENKKAEFIKFKKYYDFFCKNNQKIKNHIINLKKNSSMNNNIKNLSNISETNNYNINNISNDNIKNEDLENKQIQERIQKRHQENKKKMIYLKELEKKNQKLINDYQEIKMKNIEYNKALERLFKFLRVLKNNGMDIQEMMDNISSGEDYDEYLDIDEETEESDDSEEEEQNEVVLSDGSVISNLKQLSTGLLRNHDEFTKGSKLNLKENIIPMLKLYKIKKN